MNRKTWLMGSWLVLLLLGCGSPPDPRPGLALAAVTQVCPHTLTTATCPFCTPSLIEAGGMCGGHGVPEALCSRCNAALIPAFKSKNDWCGGHDLPESQCLLCNPELAATEAPAEAAVPAASAGACPHTLTNATCPFCTPSLIEAGGMCGEHGVPEALCSRCNASLIPAFKSKNDWCGEHDLPESQCVLCNPELASASPPAPPPAPEPFPRSRKPPSTTCQTLKQIVTLASEEVATVAGLAWEAPTETALAGAVVANAEVTYQEDHVAHLAPPAPATVVDFAVPLGATVAKGAVLAWVNCPELGQAKAAYHQAELALALAKDQLRSGEELARQGIIGSLELMAFRTEHQEHLVERDQTLQALSVFGLTPEQLKNLPEGARSDGRLAIRAPFEGSLVARTAVVGETVDSQTPVLTFADLRQFWLRIQVQEADQSLVRLGQPVVFQTPGQRGFQVGGTVTWISPALDPVTRTLEVRATLPNEGGLRVGMFGKATLNLSQAALALQIPKAAVQWEGCCNVAFVRTSPVRFEPRKLRLGAETANGFVVESGLQAGEDVVTTGSFLLKTEILKGQIGAGCCEFEPGK